FAPPSAVHPLDLSRCSSSSRQHLRDQNRRRPKKQNQNPLAHHPDAISQPTPRIKRLFVSYHCQLLVDKSLLSKRRGWGCALERAQAGEKGDAEELSAQTGLCE